MPIDSSVDIKPSRRGVRSIKITTQPVRLTRELGQGTPNRRKAARTRIKMPPKDMGF